MINRMTIFIGMLLLPILGLAQQGINFEHISLEEAMVKARQEKKLIFIDFYTDWCAPCKAMAKNIFTLEVVGNEYNKSFINLKINAEKEGVNAAKKYAIMAYPTMMFINADGQLIYKKVGSTDVNGVLMMSKEALTALKSGTSLVDLKNEYPTKRNDEAFLKLFIDKSIKAGDKPFDAMEDYLKIQKSIKPNSSRMLDFYLANKGNMILGGKAEQILDENYDAFMDICTHSEESYVKTMKAKMLTNTRDLAQKEKNPELMKFFIDRFKDFKAEEGEELQDKDLIYYQLEYFAYAKDYNGYRELANKFLDSVVSAKTLTELRASDKAAYEKYMSDPRKAADYSLVGRGVKANFKLGKEALAQEKMIRGIGATYIALPDNKKADYKKLMSWVDYGMNLVPEHVTIPSFKANVLYKQGKVKEAIALKESVLAKLENGDKEYTVVSRELEDMKKALKK